MFSTNGACEKDFSEAEDVLFQATRMLSQVPSVRPLAMMLLDNLPLQAKLVVTLLARLAFFRKNSRVRLGPTGEVPPLIFLNAMTPAQLDLEPFANRMH